MKKILISILLISFIFVTGCTTKVEKIENKNEKSNQEVLKVVSNKQTIENLQLIDENILLTSLGLTMEEVDDYFGKIPVYNVPNENMYIAIKPKKKNEKVVERALNLYVSDIEYKIFSMNSEEEKENADAYKQLKNMIKDKYKGYYIYISTQNNSEVLKIIKNRI